MTTLNSLEYIALKLRVGDGSIMKEFVRDELFDEAELHGARFSAESVCSDPFVEFNKWVCNTLPDMEQLYPITLETLRNLASAVEKRLNEQIDNPPGQLVSSRITNDPFAKSGERGFDNCRDEPGDIYLWLTYSRRNS